MFENRKKIDDLGSRGQVSQILSEKCQQKRVYDRVHASNIHIFWLG